MDVLEIKCKTYFKPWRTIFNWKFQLSHILAPLSVFRATNLCTVVWFIAKPKPQKNRPITHDQKVSRSSNGLMLKLQLQIISPMYTDVCRRVLGALGNVTGVYFKAQNWNLELTSTHQVFPGLQQCSRLPLIHPLHELPMNSDIHFDHLYHVVTN